MSAAEETAVDVARVYVGARMRAALLSTWRLRRVERDYRRDVADGRPVGMRGRASWAAARAELTDRGKRLPPAERPPRRRPWR